MAQIHRYDGDTTSRRWQDWVNLVLAVWLFISPWILAYAASGAAPAGGETATAYSAAWNAWIFGVVAAVVALWAMSQSAAWQEWVNLLVGLWLFVAPWVLGFSGVRTAAWDHW